MANYYVLLTDYGKSFIANAQANSQLALTHVVLGDANDQPYLPESRLNQTSLVKQRAKQPITSVKVINDTTAEVTAVIPSNVGGFNVHEIGVTDSSGKLVYVGNFHGGYRPTLTEGAGGDMELIITIKADNLATVIIEAESQTVVATREWVTERFVTKPDFQGHLDAMDPHSQYLKTEVFQQHLDSDDPHSQYVFESDYNLAIQGLQKQIDELKQTAGIGAVLGRIDVTFSGGQSNFSKSDSTFTVGFSRTVNGEFNLIPVGNFETAPLGEIDCRQDDAGRATRLITLNYLDGWDASKHEVRSDVVDLTEKEDSTGVHFYLPYHVESRHDDIDNYNEFRYWVDETYYFEIVQK